MIDPLRIRREVIQQYNTTAASIRAELLFNTKALLSQDNHEEKIIAQVLSDKMRGETHHSYVNLGTVLSIKDGMDTIFIRCVIINDDFKKLLPVIGSGSAKIEFTLSICERDVLLLAKVAIP